jgi:hypothetical protein
MEISAIGGKYQQRNLTLELLKNNPAEYETAKAVFWLSMLKKRMKPTKFLKPNKNGTGVHFEMLNDQQTYDMAWGEFEGFVANINKQHSLDLKLVDKN